MSNVYHVIESSGTVTTAAWEGPLEDGCIPQRRIRELISVREIEHVTVIWQGRIAHLFIDELAFMRDPPPEPNAKATRIYMNAALRREGHHDFLYERLDESPMFKVRDIQAHAKARILIGTAKMILGRALLWEGAYE